GVGVFYEAPLFFQYRSPIFRSLPFVSRAVLVRPALPIDTSLASASGPLETESFTFEPEAASVVRYNLVGQRELGRGTVVTLGYVGSRGRNLFGQGDTNTARPEILADGSEFFPEDAPRRNPAFLAVDTIFQGFRSRYDSLQVGVVHRRESLRLQAAYTLGSSRDNRSGSGGRQEFTNGQARTFDPYDLDRDWGPSDFDVRHNLVANASWEFRLGRGWLGDGWQVNGIATYASGLPFTPIIPGDPDRDGSDSNVARPDALPGATTVPAGGRSAERWFDPAAFSFPTLGTRGNAGRNSLRGPALALVDVGLVKTVPLRGTAKLQLRLEVFNVLNRANLDLPLNDQDGAAVFDDGGQPNPTAGRISRTVTDAREAQIALKLIF
ncbi:MAG TPA: hypothetical protein VMR21_17235, partial [Vicinamibacteria bacterium]|nr:hypothetical protein [Vicinamibacteria bacterium]